jgi:hypothetical protein
LTPAIKIESLVTGKRHPRESGPDKSPSETRRLPPVSHDAEAFILGDAESEADAVPNRLGTGIELEIARMNRVLNRMRETRIVNWYWSSLNREPRANDDYHTRLIQVRRHQFRSVSL